MTVVEGIRMDTCKELRARIGSGLEVLLLRARQYEICKFEFMKDYYISRMLDMAKQPKGFKRHLKILLVKLEYQQGRLLVWGDLAGICDEKQRSVGPIPEPKHNRQDRTKRCLDSI